MYTTFIALIPAARARLTQQFNPNDDDD